MEYVKFGRSGLKVSRLAYGLGLRGQEDAGEAERTIERAVELGINFIDCANIYGFGDVYETRGTSEQVSGARPQAAPRRPRGHLESGQPRRRRA